MEIQPRPGVSHCFSKYKFLMIKVIPQHCEHTKIHQAKQRKLTAKKAQVVAGRNMRRCWRSKEGKLSVGQREGIRIAVSGEGKTLHWRRPQAEGHQHLKGQRSNYPGHSPARGEEHSPASTAVDQVALL